MSEPMRATMFGVGDVEYAVSGRVTRILPAGRPLPERIDHRGAGFPVVDLSALFAGGGAGERGGDEPLLLLVEESAEDGAPPVRRALVVERLSGTERLDPAAIEPVPEVYPERERRRWRGLVPRPGGRLAILLDLTGFDVPAGRMEA